MIVWINGASGAAVRAVARELSGILTDGTLFDPRDLVARLPAAPPEGSDPLDLPLWRRLFVETAAALLDEVGGVLVVPLPLYAQERRDHLFGRLASRAIAVHHVRVEADETILHAWAQPVRAETVRVEAAQGDHLATTATRTRPAHLNGATAPAPAARASAYATALAGWLAADAHPLPADPRGPRPTAEALAGLLASGALPACPIVQTAEPTAETLAAGVLLFDRSGRFLLVDPTYKPGWEFPGGVVERGEAPSLAGLREVAEETGVRLRDTLRLLVVDWEPPMPPGFGGMRLLFDGGNLPEAVHASLALPGPELRDWRFVTEEEAAGLLPPVRYARLRWALRARRAGSIAYLERGKPLTD
ncbi:NUDIX domain-containing protein [Streptomyces sp. SPB074]|uniref:NUDIX domain-containing protein n=1 Tax=Streptomyces sp. (strain SPB074) TaxID=465543 RepID=UPI00017F1993|nr:NUDIX hydrolase [Streptomyces sp. SPB074]EDY44789.1 ATP/GTP-binding protein [Streptomyces sp. SPB074]